MANDGPPSFGPEQFLQMHMSMAPSRVISAAVRFDVFGQLAAGCDNAVVVARAAGTSERGMRMLLDALCALGLVAKQGGRYRASESAGRYLARSSPDYLGAIMETDDLWNAWGSLPETIRTGCPPHRVEDQAKAESFFPTLVRSLHVINREPARRAAAALVGGHGPGLRVIDIACGSAIWGIAMAEADPGVRVTAQDFPGVLAGTRRYVARSGVAERFDYLEGDLETMAFPDAAYDLAILGNIVHSMGETASRALFRRLHRALRRDGRIAIIDMVPNDERTGPLFPVLFALNMLVQTELGDTYTVSEYRAWLAQAGYADLETVDIGTHSPMLVATKKG